MLYIYPTLKKISILAGEDKYTHTHTHTHTQIHTHTHIYTHTHTIIYIYVIIVKINKYIYSYICITHVYMIYICLRTVLKGRTIKFPMFQMQLLRYNNLSKISEPGEDIAGI